jgi:hypothetical protein
MAKVKLSGFANINVGSNPGNIRAYTGVAGDVLDVPEDVARLIVEYKLGTPEDGGSWLKRVIKREVQTEPDVEPEVEPEATKAEPLDVPEDVARPPRPAVKKKR